MQAGLPVLACTDRNTDIGDVVVKDGFGWWCESNDVSAFCDLVSKALEREREDFLPYIFTSLNNNYSVKCAYDAINVLFGSD